MTAAFESLLPVFLLADTLITADIQALPITGITFTMLAGFATLAGSLLLLRGPRPR